MIVQSVACTMKRNVSGHTPIEAVVKINQACSLLVLSTYA